MPSHYPLIDAHTHLGSDSERSERQKKQILSLVCASTPPEAEALLKTAKPYLLPTAGLHPWQAASYFVNDMLPYLTARLLSAACATLVMSRLTARKKSSAPSSPSPAK